MEKKALFYKTKKELYEIAKKLRVPKRSLLSKTELIKQIFRLKDTIKGIINPSKVTKTPDDLNKFKTPPLLIPKEENLQEIIEDSKYQVTINHHYMHEDLGDLPYSYNEDKIVAMVVDPQRIYLYWDISSHTYHRIAGNDKISKPYLRVANPKKEEEYFEIGINNGMQNYYLSARPDNEYVVSYGVYDKRKWIEISRSTSCKTPPIEESTITENSFIYIPFKIKLEKIKEILAKKIKSSGSLGKALLDLRKEKKLPHELTPSTGFVKIDSELLQQVSPVQDRLKSSLARDKLVGY